MTDIHIVYLYSDATKAHYHVRESINIDQFQINSFILSRKS
jgi:hypothetical protein